MFKALMAALPLFCFASITQACAQGWVDVDTNAHASAPTGRQIAARETSIFTNRSVSATVETGLQAPQSVNNAEIGKQSFNLGFGSGSGAPYSGGYASRGGSALPVVSTSAVDISITDAEAPPPRLDDNGSGGSGGSDPNLPPPPGEGYQPCYQHGVFVGYYSPEEVALAQTDFRACLRSFVNSDRYLGGESGRRSILFEIGDIDSPF